VRDIEGPAVGGERARQFSLPAAASFGRDAGVRQRWAGGHARSAASPGGHTTRVGPDDREREPYLSEEALDPDAIAAHTAGAAYTTFLDGETGTIEPGKAADLVILDRNLFAGQPGQIGDTRVLATVLDGEPVYSLMDAFADCT
jgi:hypothetical protein